MKRLIAVMSFAALAHSAFAGENYTTPEVNNTEGSAPDVSQTDSAPREQAQLDSAQFDQASAEAVVETESAATGDSTPSDGESAAAETDSESPAEIDQ
jgi:hypothetical protein